MLRTALQGASRGMASWEFGIIVAVVDHLHAGDRGRDARERLRPLARLRIAEGADLPSRARFTQTADAVH